MQRTTNLLENEGTIGNERAESSEENGCDDGVRLVRARHAEAARIRSNSRGCAHCAHIFRLVSSDGRTGRHDGENSFVHGAPRTADDCVFRVGRTGHVRA